MISKKMENMVANSSAIRAMFEEGNRLAAKYGVENVFDFSLGNPNVPAPEAVKKAMIEILSEEDPIVLHGYTNSNAGYEDVRQAVADFIKRVDRNIHLVIVRIDDADHFLIAVARRNPYQTAKFTDTEVYMHDKIAHFHLLQFLHGECHLAGSRLI